MGNSLRVVVTGAYGYSGHRIAGRLLDAGCEVATLTNRTPDDDPFGGRVSRHRYSFEDPSQITKVFEGVDVFCNTYWVRFNHGSFSHEQAVTNTMAMFEAAKQAGVTRIVHTSITNPSEDSPLEYFRGKGALERGLRETGLSHAILRPAVLFGGEDILINNIAWTIRRLPVVGVFGDGQYRLQPIHVDDFANLAAAQCRSSEDGVINAIGPETFTYERLLRELMGILGVRRPIIHVPPGIGYVTARLLGLLVRDVVLTREEIEGLMADLLYVEDEPAGSIRLTDWAREHADGLGQRYHSELARRQR